MTRAAFLGRSGSEVPGRGVDGCVPEQSLDLGGVGYTVWEGVQTTEPTISYEMDDPATSVTGLDVYPIARDAVSRGYISRFSCIMTWV